MKTETLEEFVLLAQYMNFRAAAKELFISQSALSTHIMSLEQELGFPLFERGDKLTLTDGGRAFLGWARNTLSELEEVKHAFLEPQSSPIRVACRNPSHFDMQVLTLCLKAAETDIPFQMVTVGKNNTNLELLESGSIDAYFSTTGIKPVLAVETEEYRRLGYEGVSAGYNIVTIAVMAASPLGRKQTLHHADLVGATVTIDYTSPVGMARKNYEQLLGSDLNLQFVRNNLSGYDTLDIDYGDTILIVGYNYAQKHCFPRDDMKCFSAVDGLPLLVDRLMVYNRNSANPNMEAFARAVGEHSKEVSLQLAERIAR